MAAAGQDIRARLLLSVYYLTDEKLFAFYILAAYTVCGIFSVVVIEKNVETKQ